MRLNYTITIYYTTHNLSLFENRSIVYPYVLNFCQEKNISLMKINVVMQLHVAIRGMFRNQKIYQVKCAQNKMLIEY